MLEEERAGRGEQLANLFAANEILSKMTSVYAKHKTGSTENCQEVEKWGKYFAMASRWGGFFLFM